MTFVGEKRPAGHPNWIVVDRNKVGEKIWGPPPKNPGKKPAKKPSGGTHQPSGGGGTSSAEAKAKAAEAWKQSLLSHLQSYLDDTNFPMPKWMRALKYEDKAKYGDSWLKDKYKELGYIPKAQREKYRASIVMMLREWMGTYYDPKDKELQKLIDDWSKSDPNKRGTNDVRLFVQNKLSKTKAFEAAFPGYKFFAKAWQLANGTIPLPDDYRTREQEFKAVWEEMFGLDVKVDPTWIAAALTQAWTKEKFALAVKSSNYYRNTSGQQQTVARFNNLWDAMFKGTQFEAVKDTMAEKYRLSGMDFDEFFDLQLQQDASFSGEFNKLFPEYEAFRNQAQVENPGTYVSIEMFMQRREELGDIFQDTLEEYGIEIPPELLSRALAEGWSDERMQQFLKTDPEWSDVYMGTNEAKVKAIDFNQYWKGILGSDVEVDAQMLADYVANGGGDPTEYLNKIRETSAFRQQYGYWDEFMQSQDAAGNTGVVIRNPETYKEWRKGFLAAFAEIGEPVPEGYERMFFQSGQSSDKLAMNLNQWYNQEQSYQWGTGKAADMATAAGIKNPTEGGDLRNRMQKALEQHKKFAASQFNEFETARTSNGKIVGKI